MKYTGRLILALISLSVGIPYAIYNFITLQSINRLTVDLTVIFSVAILGYWLGKQYDKASFYEAELRKNEQLLKESNQELQDIFDHVDAMLWSNDLVNKKVVVSKGIEKLYGYTAKDFSENYTLWMEPVHPDDKEGLHCYFQELLSGKSSGRHEMRIIRPDGKIKWIESSANPIYHSSGQMNKVIGSIFDITDRKLIEKDLQQALVQLEESEMKYRALFENAEDVIMLFGVQEDGGPANFINVNQMSCETLGYSVDEFLSMNPRDIMPEEREKETPDVMPRLLKNGSVTFEGYLITKIGEEIPFEFNANLLNLNGKRVVLSIARNIFKRKKLEEKLTKMAYYDELTGLPNRVMLRGYMKKLISRSKRHDHPFSVFFIDLDGFKRVNDTLGHDIGDLLLKEVANKLAQCIREEDMACRLGGDEFIIILDECHDDLVTTIAKRIQDEVSQPFLIKDNIIEISPSIGISIYPKDGEDEEILFQKADKAMYQVKKTGKNNFLFYEAEFENNEQRKLDLFDKIIHLFQK